jgi:hypothetical protein
MCLVVVMLVFAKILRARVLRDLIFPFVDHRAELPLWNPRALSMYVVDTHNGSSMRHIWVLGVCCLIRLTPSFSCHDLQSNWDQVVESFDDLGLKDELLRGIYAYGFEKPSAIQQRAILPCVKGSYSTLSTVFNLAWCHVWGSFSRVIEALSLFHSDYRVCVHRNVNVT